MNDKQKFITDLRSAASRIFNGWRALERYANAMPLDELLAKRYGLLMSAPLSFARLVMQVAEENDVALNMLDGGQAKGEKARALLLDTWYVVADTFRAELLT